MIHVGIDWVSFTIVVLRFFECSSSFVHLLTIHIFNKINVEKKNPTTPHLF